MHRQQTDPQSISRPSFEHIPHPCTFYFVRHGQSVANARGAIQGRDESPLSEQGKIQARRAGTWLRGQGITTIYSSPQQRTRQTAEIIADVCSRDYTAHPEFRELDTGLFTSKTWEDIQRDHPEVHARFTVHSWEAVPEAESMASLTERAQQIWQRLIETAAEHAAPAAHAAPAEHAAPAIVSVIHGGILQWIIKTAIGAPQLWMPLFPAANCAIFSLQVRPAQYPDAHTINRGYYAAWNRMNFEAPPIPENSPPPGGTTDTGADDTR